MKVGQDLASLDPGGGVDNHILPYPALICNCTKSECGLSECGEVSAESNLSADSMVDVRICSMINCSGRSFLL